MPMGASAPNPVAQKRTRHKSALLQFAIKILLSVNLREHGGPKQ
jgi:hypothetical protein